MPKKQTASKTPQKRGRRRNVSQAKPAPADPKAVKVLDMIAAAIRGVLDAAPSPPASPMPLVQPGHTLPPDQFPSVEQIAQLAAILGQAHQVELQKLIDVIPCDPSSDVNQVGLQNGYFAATKLTNAAMMLWRAANDVRFVWLQTPVLQLNYQLAKESLRKPKDNVTNRFHTILTKLKVAREEQDKAIWAWNEAASVLFGKGTPSELDYMLTEVVTRELIQANEAGETRAVDDLRQNGIPFDEFATLLFATEEKRNQRFRDIGELGGIISGEKRRAKAKAKAKQAKNPRKPKAD